MEMKYQNYLYTDKAEVSRLLLSDSEKVRASAIVGMVNGISDVQWVEDQLLHLLDDSSFWVAKGAIVGLGNLARIHGQLNQERVKAAFETIERADLKGAISDTLDDFNIFL